MKTLGEGVSTVRSTQKRRQFLQAASGLLTVPFLSLRGSKAHALAKPPLRLLTIMDSYGVPTNDRSQVWAESSVGDYALTEESLGTILAPLSAYHDNMLVISGMRSDSMIETNTGTIHEFCTAHALTGSKQKSGRRAGATQHNASIDVHIGDYLSNEYGLPYPRVYPHLFFTDRSQSDRITFCFNSQGNQIRAIAGPTSIANSVFGSLENLEALKLDTKTQQLALGLVADKLQTVRGELINANASTVFDAYQSSVEDLATELEIRANLVCNAPDATLMPPDDAPSGETNPAIFSNIYHAFACDLASSITYSIGGERMNRMGHAHLYDTAGIQDGDLEYRLGADLHNTSHKDHEMAQKTHEIIRAYQSTLLADLLDKLSTTPDVDGSMMLDNTVVFVTSAMGCNVHSINNFAHLVIAGKNANLRSGFHYDCSGSTNNDLMTTIANGLTLPDTDFGGYTDGGERLSQLNHGPITKMLK